MFNKVRIYILLHNLRQKTSGSKLRVLLRIMSMAITRHWLRVGPSDMYRTRKASFKDTLVIGVQQGKCYACAPGSYFRLYFTRCKHEDCDAISQVHKVHFEGLLLIFSCPCCAPVVMPNRRNQYNFSILHWLYIWERRWILALLLVSVDLNLQIALFRVPSAF